MALPLDRVIRNATGRFRADRVDRIGPAVRTEGFIPDVLVGAIEIGLRRCICGDLLLFQCPALLRAINLFEVRDAVAFGRVLMPVHTNGMPEDGECAKDDPQRDAEEKIFFAHSPVGCA